MSWVLIAIAAYFTNSIVSVTDKFLVSKKIPNPIAYSFFVGILSLFAAAFIPFADFSIPSLKVLTVALASGAVFLLALIFFFSVLCKEEVSRASAIAFGGLMPIFTLIFSALIIKETLNLVQISAFIFLIAGSVLIYHQRKSKKGAEKYFIKLLIASALFALSYVLAKWVYLYEPFLNGFIWARLGSVVAAILLLIPAKNRQAIFKAGQDSKAHSGFLLAGNKALGGVYFILLNWAISKGNVAIVNALQGVQYVFIFLITLLLSIKFPDIIKEELNHSVIARKIFAIILIGIGLAILSL